MRDFYRPQLGIILDDLRVRLDRRDPALISVEFGGAKNWEDNPDLQWVEPPLCAYEAQLYPKLARLHAELVSGPYEPRAEDSSRGYGSGRAHSSRTVSADAACS